MIALATEYQAKAEMKSERWPNLSAMTPNPRQPTNMPASPENTKKPARSLFANTPLAPKPGTT